MSDEISAMNRSISASSGLARFHAASPLAESIPFILFFLV
jgi:hypothetical protein